MLGDRLHAETQRAIYDCMHLLAIRLDQLEGRLDEAQIQNNDFLELFKSAYLVVIRSHKKERHIGAANLLANLLLKSDDSERLSYTQLDHFVRCLDNLSIGALECLAAIYEFGSRVNMQSGQRVQQISFRSIHNRLSHYAPDLLMGTVRELDAHNLVHLSGAPDIKTENYGNYPVYLSDIGVDFVEQILRDFSSG
jgi:hypothetical protein